MKSLSTYRLLGLFLCLSLCAPAWAERAEFLLSAEQLQEKLSETTVLWIGMEAQAPSRGHIPGSAYVSWGELTTTRDGVPNELPSPAELETVFRKAGVPKTGRIALYDDGSGLPAARAFLSLDYLGQGERTAILDGGLPVWVKAGLPLQERPTKLKAGDFEAEVQGFRLISGQELLKSLGDLTLFDARPKSEFQGKEAGEGVERPGHIPGASNVFWQKHLKDGQLKSAEKLAEMYSEAEGAQGLVSYCRTGGQASHSYFVLRYLGYEPRLYDGSFYEWSRSFGPVERETMKLWRSKFSASETRVRLLQALARRNLTVMADIDHQAGAEKVGLKMEFTRLVIFGNPQVGTPLMQKSGSVALDLPLKIAIWEDQNGVHLAYQDPHTLNSRHRLDSPPQLAKMSQALEDLAREAGGI